LIEIYTVVSEIKHAHRHITSHYALIVCSLYKECIKTVLNFSTTSLSCFDLLFYCSFFQNVDIIYIHFAAEDAQVIHTNDLRSESSYRWVWYGCLLIHILCKSEVISEFVKM